MTMRRLAAPIAAVLLALGLTATGTAVQASAAPRHQVQAHDTGWG